MTVIISTPLSTVLSYVCIFAIAYYTLILIYRVTWHPLARYPGPLRYKLSAWPLVWQAYQGNRHLFHFKDHEKYGSVVRIAPDTLSFNNETALNTIYGSRNVNVIKGEWYKTFDIAVGTYSSFTETDKEKHAAKRRWLSPAFAEMLNKMAELRTLENVERFCDALKPKEEWSEKMNMSILTNYLGFDIMGDLVFGAGFRTVDRKAYRDLADSIIPAATFLYWVSYLPFAWFVRPLLRTRLVEIVGGKGVEDNNRLIDYASGQVNERLQEKNGESTSNDDGHRDFMHYLINVTDRKSGWTPSQLDLDVECLNLMNAGADPYASMLAAAFFYLLHNEDTLKKATTEVRSAFESQEDIRNGTKLNSCTYLFACIEETLRHAAPIPSHLPRLVLPGGLDIDGHHIPAGITVGVPTYTIHHNAAYFPEPFTFRPERWIESTEMPQENIKRAQRAFAPFGLGYDMRLSPDELGRGGGGPDLEEGRHRVDEFQLKDALGFARDGPMAQFRLAQRV